MSENKQLKELSDKLQLVKEVLILLGPKPTFDGLAASLGLALTLEEEGKKVNIICPVDLTIEFSDLFGIDQVKRELAGKNLVISFDYAEGAIDKVSYNISGDKFNLIIQPKKGAAPLPTDKIKFSNQGISADLVFIVDIRDLSELSNLDGGTREALTGSFIVNIDYVNENKDFGQVNLVNVKATGCSEVVAALLRILKLKVPADAATNLLLGIDRKTDFLTISNLEPEVFEATAYLLRLGAKRKAAGGEKLEVGKEEVRKEVRTSMTKDIFEEKKEVEEKEKKEEKKEPPDDWLTPKVYQGGKLI